MDRILPKTKHPDRIFKHPSTMSRHEIAWNYIKNCKTKFKRHPLLEKISKISTMFQLENSSKIKVWWTLFAINNIIAEYESKSLPLITHLF